MFSGQENRKIILEPQQCKCVISFSVFRKISWILFSLCKLQPMNNYSCILLKQSQLTTRANLIYHEGCCSTLKKSHRILKTRGSRWLHMWNMVVIPHIIIQWNVKRNISNKGNGSRIIQNRVEVMVCLSTKYFFLIEKPWNSYL